MSFKRISDVLEKLKISVSRYGPVPSSSNVSKLSRPRSGGIPSSRMVPSYQKTRPASVDSRLKSYRTDDLSNTKCSGRYEMPIFQRDYANNPLKNVVNKLNEYNDLEKLIAKSYRYPIYRNNCAPPYRKHDEFNKMGLYFESNRIENEPIQSVNPPDETLTDYAENSERSIYSKDVFTKKIRSQYQPLYSYKKKMKKILNSINSFTNSKTPKNRDIKYSYRYEAPKKHLYSDSFSKETITVWPSLYRYKGPSKLKKVEPIKKFKFESIKKDKSFKIKTAMTSPNVLHMGIVKYKRHDSSSPFHQINPLLLKQIHKGLGRNAETFFSKKFQLNEQNIRSKNNIYQFKQKPIEKSQNKSNDEINGLNEQNMRSKNFTLLLNNSIHQFKQKSIEKSQNKSNDEINGLNEQNMRSKNFTFLLNNSIQQFKQKSIEKSQNKSIDKCQNEINVLNEQNMTSKNTTLPLNQLKQKPIEKSQNKCKTIDINELNEQNMTSKNSTLPLNNSIYQLKQKPIEKSQNKCKSIDNEINDKKNEPNIELKNIILQSNNIDQSKQTNTEISQIENKFIKKFKNEVGNINLSSNAKEKQLVEGSTTVIAKPVDIESKHTPPIIINTASESKNASNNFKKINIKTEKPEELKITQEKYKHSLQNKSHDTNSFKKDISQNKLSTSKIDKKNNLKNTPLNRNNFKPSGRRSISTYSLLTSSITEKSLLDCPHCSYNSNRNMSMFRINKQLLNQRMYSKTAKRLIYDLLKLFQIINKTRLKKFTALKNLSDDDNNNNNNTKWPDSYGVNILNEPTLHNAINENKLNHGDIGPDENKCEPIALYKTNVNKLKFKSLNNLSEIKSFKPLINKNEDEKIENIQLSKKEDVFSSFDNNRKKLLVNLEKFKNTPLMFQCENELRKRTNREKLIYFKSDHSIQRPGKCLRINEDNLPKQSYSYDPLYSCKYKTSLEYLKMKRNYMKKTRNVYGSYDANDLNASQGGSTITQYNRFTTKTKLKPKSIDKSILIDDDKQLIKPLNNLSNDKKSEISLHSKKTPSLIPIYISTNKLLNQKVNSIEPSTSDNLVPIERESFDDDDDDEFNWKSSQNFIPTKVDKFHFNHTLDEDIDALNKTFEELDVELKSPKLNIINENTESKLNDNQLTIALSQEDINDIEETNVSFIKSKSLTNINEYDDEEIMPKLNINQLTSTDFQEDFNETELTSTDFQEDFNETELTSTGYHEDYNETESTSPDFQEDYNETELTSTDFQEDYNETELTSTGYQEDINETELTSTGYQEDFNETELTNPDVQEDFNETESTSTVSQEDINETEIEVKPLINPVRKSLPIIYANKFDNKTMVNNLSLNGAIKSKIDKQLEVNEYNEEIQLQHNPFFIKPIQLKPIEMKDKLKYNQFIKPLETNYTLPPQHSRNKKFKIIKHSLAKPLVHPDLQILMKNSDKNIKQSINENIDDVNNMITEVNNVIDENTRILERTNQIYNNYSEIDEKYNKNSFIKHSPFLQRSSVKSVNSLKKLNIDLEKEKNIKNESITLNLNPFLPKYNNNNKYDVQFIEENEKSFINEKNINETTPIRVIPFLPSTDIEDNDFNYNNEQESYIEELEEQNPPLSSTSSNQFIPHITSLAIDLQIESSKQSIDDDQETYLSCNERLVPTASHKMPKLMLNCEKSWYTEDLALKRRKP